MNREHYLSKRLRHEFRVPFDRPDERKREADVADISSSMAAGGEPTTAVNAPKPEAEPEMKSGVR